MLKKENVISIKFFNDESRAQFLSVFSGNNTKYVLYGYESIDVPVAPGIIDESRYFPRWQDVACFAESVFVVVRAEPCKK